MLIFFFLRFRRQIYLRIIKKMLVAKASSSHLTNSSIFHCYEPPPSIPTSPPRLRPLLPIPPPQLLHETRRDCCGPVERIVSTASRQSRHWRCRDGSSDGVTTTVGGEGIVTVATASTGGMRIKCGSTKFEQLCLHMGHKVERAVSHSSVSTEGIK